MGVKNVYIRKNHNSPKRIVFIAVSALLIANNLQAKKHSGVKQFFGLHFINAGIINKYFGKF